MDLSKIISVTGKGGLFKVISQNKNGFIVESLVDGKKFPVTSNYQASSLEEISIYTFDDDLPLKVVLKKIYEKEEGKPAINPKKASSQEIKDYMKTILPDYDDERVYVSDMKKLFTWYNLLSEKNILDFTEEEEEEEAKEETENQEKKENTEE